MRLLLTLAILLMLAIASMAWATAGFQALTSEEVRRISIERSPVPIPDARIVLTTGKETTLLRLLSETERTTIVTFIFTRCTGLCAVMSNELKRMQTNIEANGQQGDVALLTLSFDPENDSLEILTEYGENIDANAAIWRLASIPDAKELRRVLQTFGIVAIPDGFGGFEHNAAFHIVQPDGTLVAVIDQEKPRTALQRAIARDVP